MLLAMNLLALVDFTSSTMALQHRLLYLVSAKTSGKRTLDPSCCVDRRNKKTTQRSVTSRVPGRNGSLYFHGILPSRTGMIGGDDGDDGENGDTSMLKVLADQRTVPKDMRRLTAVETLWAAHSMLADICKG